ncbi:uncharacterized protein LOC110064775 [Orbicella faveolata]|uniref:uncharacterized protein LOC110064775 n=2 Tax=Orbicella faveolata TaxID=48498 RepID=UPI0009E3A8C0|nr:uncharacterized protein LOC110064775 [Orbicella faveolata]XP_020627536.1 uncharacterized protein LOC110064775 [Orbicella faveolata]
MRDLNWESARRNCLDSGGDLVSITDQSEMSFVSNKSLNVWNQHYWIGLNDRRNESQFVWSDGTPYNASVYSNWHPMEPNDQGGEDCVELKRTHWNDESCKKKFGYICEKPKGPPRINVTTVIPSVTSVPPRILNHVSPTSVICEKYTLCCLCCYATSDSPVTYSWTKNGQDPINDDIKVINNNMIFVTPGSAQDYGVYVCNASNSFGSTTCEITLTEYRKSATKATTKGEDSFSNIYRIIVIALSCLVLVLLIAVSLLTWRLRRAVNNNREKTPRRDTSDEVKQHDSTRDQYVPEELSYMELKPIPLEELPHATQNYQSLQDAVTSSAYYNAGIKRGNNNQEDEIYYEIGNAQC